VKDEAMSLIQLENRVGKPIKAGPYKIVPIEGSLQLQPPGMRGFFFWRKPSSVIVQHPDGSDEVLEIPDVTRQAQIAMISIAFTISLLVWLFARKHQETSIIN
jgi:hypothetical protein